MHISQLIKELALKSDLVVGGAFEPLTSPYVEGTDLSEKIQKFGDLVIAECLQCLQERERALDSINVSNDHDARWVRARKVQAALMIAEVKQRFKTVSEW